MRPVARLAVSLPAAAVVLAAADALAQGCAMCGSSFGENDPVTRAFSWSILFLMATPYTIVGLIGAYLYYLHRRGGRRPRPAVVRLARSPSDGGQGDLA
jgi:hypothetical protein